MPSPFVILTGASGSGKTTIAHALRAQHPSITVYCADARGVPSAEVIASFGEGHQPGGAWQRSMTLQWIDEIAPTLTTGRPVLLEGQMRIAFIREALARHDISHARVVLVECGDPTRTLRLTHDRQQPELANQSMMDWSRYLHQEAVDLGLEILDSGTMTLDQSVAHITGYLLGS